MRSIWNESMNNNYSPTPSTTNVNTNNNSVNNSLTSNIDYPNDHHLSSPLQKFHLVQPSEHQNQQRDDTQRLPPFSSPKKLVNDDQNSQNLYPPTSLDRNWPGNRYDSTNFDHETAKRRRLSSQSTAAVTATTSNPIDINNYDQPSNTTAKKVVRRASPNRAHYPTPSTSSTLVSTATDTYYHQSRRKKRDTKPPNANDIRPFVEVEKTKDGGYVLPAEVDSWTVLSLGSVVWDRAAFHNQRYIYPVGYRVKKLVSI